MAYWSRALSAFLIVTAGFAGLDAASARDVASMGQDEIAALQQRLSDAGCYDGAADGATSPGLDAAVAKCPGQDPALRIETGMHSALIRSVAVDRGCSLAVTASDDKTVRVWTLPDGTLQRTVRLPLSGGNYGKIFAVALSPDGGTAAAGGYDANFEHNGIMSVTLFDALTGGSQRRIGAFKNVINHLAFSADGSKLAVALGAGLGVHVLDVATGRELMADTDFSGADTYGVAFGPDGTLYATGWDRSLRRYGPDLNRTAKVTAPGGQYPKEVSVDPTGTRLVVGYFGAQTPDLFNAATLTKTGSVDAKDIGNSYLDNVIWTSNGRIVAAGGYQKPINGHWMHLLRTFSASGKRIGSDAVGPPRTVMDLQACGPGLAFTSGDPAFGLMLANGTVKTLGMGRIADMRDKMGPAFTLSDDGTKVSFGLDYSTAHPVFFDLGSGTISDGTGEGEGLHQVDQSGLNLADWHDTVEPKLNGKPIVLTPNETARSIAVRPDRAGFVLGADFQLRGYDAAGTLRWGQSIPGIAWGVNLARDGALIAAAYDDGTVRWHRWSDGQELLALFVDVPTKRFVAWTPSGYYMASPGAEDLIGWHINRGWEQQADFFAASRFRDKFNRPDVVQRVLQTLDEGEALKQANASAHKRDDAKPLITHLPPVLRIMSPAPGGTFSDGDVAIAYAVRSPSGLPVDRIDVLIDGVRQQDRGFNRLEQPGAGESQGTLTVHLPTHNVEVALVIHSGELVGEPAKIRLAYTGGLARGDDLLKPKLYALIAGVSDYTDPSLRLGFASKDARDFGAALKAQSGGLYGDVEIKVIVDRDATRTNLIHGLKWLQKQVTSRDVGMVFLAGHGVTDAQQGYWFLPADATPEDLETSAVSQDDIKRTLNGLAGKAILFLDSCHAGQIGAEGTKRRGALDINKVVGDFAAADNGVVVFASSTGREVSQERDAWGNGAFTKALIEGIAQGKADLLHRNTITLSELDAFVTDRVKELTDGEQHPVMTKPTTVPNYPIALARQ